jgi:hypothetical protein
MSKSESDLESLDPESEACFDALCARISAELAARIAIGDDATTVAGQRTLSETHCRRHSRPVRRESALVSSLSMAKNSVMAVAL